MDLTASAFRFYKPRPGSRSNVVLAMLLIALTVGLLLPSVPVFAQLNYGRIYGSIMDQSGGAIAGATVTVLDVERGVSRPLTTDGAGGYSAPSLLPGTYTVRVETQGFETAEHSGITVGVGQDVRVDFTVQPGQQTQTVTVNGDLPMVNTTNAQLGSTLESTLLTDIPIQGRLYTRLLDFTPGVSAASGGRSPAFSFNGGHASAQVWMIDGVEDLDIFDAAGPIVGQDSDTHYLALMPLDAIQSVNVVENPKAEYGWKPGAQVDVGLKSGTNSVHGSAYGFVRNGDFDAKNPFLGPTLPKAEDEFYQFGASVGGPIKKDKLFYFGNYEGFRFTVGSPMTAQIPSSISGAGPSGSFPDAIAALNTAHVAMSTLSLNLAGCTAAGVCSPANGVFNNATASATDPIALNNVGKGDNAIIKFDYHLNDHNSLNAEYYFGDGTSDAATSIQRYWSLYSLDRAQLMRAVWVWTPNSAWVNEARFGYTRRDVSEHPGECTQNLGQPNYTAQYGLVTGAGLYPPECGFPLLTISGFTQLGSSTGMIYLTGTYSGIDNVSYTLGKHLFKFGGEYHLTRYTGNGQPTNPTGTLSFGTGGVSAFTGATALEDFLVGDASAASVLNGDELRNVDMPQIAAFFQDDYRVLPRLTLNLGLRYEYEWPITDRNNLLANFDPSTPTGLVQETSGHPVYSAQKGNLAPRVGLVWDVTGKGTTVIRTGATYVYNTVPFTVLLARDGADMAAIPTGDIFVSPNGTTIQGPGNILDSNVSLPVGQIPWATNTPIFNATASAQQCGNGLGRVNPALATNPTTNPANPAPCNLLAMNPDYKRATVTTWTLGVEHAFTNNLSLDVSYVGTIGRHWGTDPDINQPALGATSTTLSPELLRRPYYAQFPWFGSIRQWSSGLNSNYNALQMALHQRVSHGLSLTASFTYAHSIDDFSNDNNAFPMNSLDPREDRGNSSTNPALHFSVTASYVVPGFKAPGQMLQGWQIHTTVNMLGGVPYNAVDTTDDISGTGELEDRWTLAGPASAFETGGPGHVPCFGVAASTFAKAANCVTVAAGTGASGTATFVSNMPALCVSAAAAEPNGPGGTTGLQALVKYGCYYQNGAAIVAPAQGTFGSMGRDVLFDKPVNDWDLSATKDWKIKEQFTAELRIELFNVLNHTEYAAPSANPGTPTTFGQSQSSANSGNPVFGIDAPRQLQLGLKLIF